MSKLNHSIKDLPLDKLSAFEREKFLDLVKKKYEHDQYDKFHNYFFQDHKINEDGIDISRKQYPKHLEFMAKGNEYRERAFIAPNRVGKSYTGGYEIVAHVTKDYPSWWEGKRFDDYKPLEILVVGKTNQSLVSTIQKLLIGTLFDLGSGMIPKDRIELKKITKKPNCPGGVQDVYVKDKFGCINHLQFLSSDVEDDVIMGREIDVVWFDEECLNDALYGEALMRTMTTDGIVFTTFTPLDGLTKGILRFMPGGLFPEKGIVKDRLGKATGCYTVKCGWDDIPHLKEEWKVDMRRRYTGAELRARTEGIPSVGKGHVYPIPSSEIVIPNLAIPDHWKRAYGLDFGWTETAVVWVAQDPNSKNYYVYDEYMKGQQIPYVHTASIRERGAWIRGACDPAGVQTSGLDGKNYIAEYANCGLDLTLANNEIQTGVARILNLLETGRLKIMMNCEHLLEEYRVYRYDDNDRIAKNQDDHGLDALRYLMSMFDYIAISKNDILEQQYMQSDEGLYGDDGRDPVMGY